MLSNPRGRQPRMLLKPMQFHTFGGVLGAIGLFRNISTGALMGSQYFDASDPWARERALDDKAFSVDHFFVKLLRLPTTMTTEAGRVEATRRAGVLIQIIDALEAELGVPLGSHPLVDSLRQG